MAQVVAVVAELMMGSKIEAMLIASGHDVTFSASMQETTWEGADLLVTDLDAEGPEALVGLGVPVLGYYSHVNVETREVAEAAGVDLVVPRSRLVRELPELVERLLSD